MESFNLDIIPRGTMPACHSSQFDVNRTIRVYLLDNGQEYTLDGTETVTLSVRKPDNTVITANLTVGANNYVDFNTTEQMTAIVGQSICEIRIEKGETNIGTLNFVLEVEKDPLSSGIHSESVITDLQAQVDEAVAVSMNNYYTKSEVDALIENVEDNTRIVDEASGAIAQFNTDLTENLLSTVAEFSASQASGTPTPSTPIPIVGVDKVNVTRTGKNLIQERLLSKGINSSGVIGSSSSNDIIIAPVKQGQKYAITSSESNKVYAYYTDKPEVGSTSYNGTRNSTGSSQVSVTAEIDGWIAVRVPNTDTNSQIELGETITTYEAPTNTTALINLGGTYYGGSVDAVTGKITLTHGRVDLGSLDWNYRVSNSIFIASVTDLYPYVGDNDYADLNCEIYDDVAPLGLSTTNLPNLSLCQRRTEGSTTIMLNDTNYTDPALLTQAVTGKYLVFELKTPVVVYASNTAEIPTIVGDNQVFADTGDVAVKYKKSVKAYIDDKLKAIFVSYDNSNSGLTATNTQAAIDELAGANRSVNPLRTTAPVEELETRDEPETDEPETRGDDNER